MSNSDVLVGRHNMQMNPDILTGGNQVQSSTCDTILATQDS